MWKYCVHIISIFFFLFFFPKGGWYQILNWSMNSIFKCSLASSYSWCDGHSTNVNACGLWGGKGRGLNLQKRSFTHIYRVHLDWAYFCWNWKHCSKIIFKCVNSIMGPIFNEKVVEKWNLWVHKQCTNALFTVDLVK